MFTTPFQPLSTCSSYGTAPTVGGMRAILLLILFTTSSWVAGAFGTWKMNPARSTHNGSPHPESFTVRIEPHSGGWIRFVRRLAAQPKELILEITEQQPDGRRFERRLVLEKQQERN